MGAGQFPFAGHWRGLAVGLPDAVPRVEPAVEVVSLPLGVMSVFLSCWIRLYGMVCMEVFGHLRFAMDDAEPMFEAELGSLGEVLGVGDEYRPPSG